MSQFDKTVETPFDQGVAAVPAGPGVNVDRTDGVKGYPSRTPSPNSEPLSAGVGRQHVDTHGGKIPTTFDNQIAPTHSTKQS